MIQGVRSSFSFFFGNEYNEENEERYMERIKDRIKRKSTDTVNKQHIQDKIKGK